jgi:hypothetical protein
MRSVMRLGLAATLASWLALGGGCVVWSTPLFERETQVEAAYSAPAAVDVETENGSVDLFKGSAAGVLIDATIKARSQERADATEVVTQRGPDGTLLIRVVWAEGKRYSNEGCSMRISLPGAEGVRVKTGNGAVACTDLSGPAEIDTSNGRVEVTRHAGNVRAETSNGRVVIEAVAGDVKATSSNGGIDIRGARGRVEADTSNGAVSISLDASGTGPVRAETSNGSIDLVVGPSFVGRVDVDTSNGSIRADVDGVSLRNLSKTHGELVFGQSGEESRLSTSNGSITVRSGG